MAEVYEGLFHGERAFWLETSRYQVAVLPEIGGNLIAFRDRRKDYRFLREPKPEEMDGFRLKPRNHGIPVLFPPNRYQDGKFSFNGMTYSFPINEEKTGNHIHGFFYNRPWEVLDYGCNEHESSIVLGQRVDEEHEVYAYFPHLFDFRITYVLSDHGLSQTVLITNCGDSPMPCMLAFHTAVNAPFSPNSTSDDCLCRITIGERWELDARMLPTGRKVPLSREFLLKDESESPFFEVMDNHYTAEPRNGKNCMELIDTREKVRLVYDVGVQYKQWMVWNNKASGGFFCPEPQINLINAPNVTNLSDDSKGFIILQAGETWTETSRLYVEELS